MLTRLSLSMSNDVVPMPVRRTSQRFSCSVKVPAGTGLLRWFGACSSQLVATEPGLEIENLHIQWVNIQQIFRHRARLTIKTINSQMEFVVLSPLTGLRDPALAFLIEQLCVALSSNQCERAAEIFIKLRLFSKLVRLSMLVSVLLVFSAGIMAAIFPSLLFLFTLAAGLAAIVFASWPTFYANRVGQKGGVSIDASSKSGSRQPDEHR